MKSEKEKMLNGELYNPLDPELIREKTEARRLTRLFNESADDNKGMAFIKELFGSSGENIYVEAPFHCDYGYNIHAKEQVFVNFDCVFLDVCEIHIGENCLIGPGVHIYTATHPLNPLKRMSAGYGVPVNIGNNVWIGGGAIINPGVTIGNNVVIASGSVVTKDVPDNVVMGGNPAKFIKHIDDQVEV